jgi:hypothetical protein
MALSSLTDAEVRELLTEEERERWDGVPHVLAEIGLLRTIAGLRRELALLERVREAVKPFSWNVQRFPASGGRGEYVSATTPIKTSNTNGERIHDDLRALLNDVVVR